MNDTPSSPPVTGTKANLLLLLGCLVLLGFALITLHGKNEADHQVQTLRAQLNTERTNYTNAIKGLQAKANQAQMIARAVAQTVTAEQKADDQQLQQHEADYHEQFAKDKESHPVTRSWANGLLPADVGRLLH